MASSDFVIWSAKQMPGICVVTAPGGVDNREDLTAGLPMAANWPADVTCTMDNDFPDDIALADSLYGAIERVISPRVKVVLDGAGVSGVEYLPVKIVNHKGRVAAPDYLIVNPPSVVECVDIEASEVMWNRLQKDLIRRCARLVVDPAKVPPKVQLFRLKHVPFLLIARRSLADRLVASGLSGIAFKEPAEFRGA